MHHVGHIDWSFIERPAPPSATSSGLARVLLVGPEQGATHTDLAAVALLPGGWLAPHVHSFEEALYVLDGEILVTIGDAVHHLASGDYALYPTGVRHALGNTSDAPVRILSLTSPQRLAPDAGRKDTF
ncbi:MAG TPA: cupin domain-containing protein, partial [Candidatus Deferrimicrobium sp.]|nr:cupin domain-containing protein [Candidatus Deferrimicrobium sp.]